MFTLDIGPADRAFGFTWLLLRYTGGMQVFWELARRAARKFQDDACMDLAASMAYYTVFSLFPLALGLITIAGVLAEPQVVRTQVVAALSERFPGSGDFLTNALAEVVAARTTLGLVALIGLLWSATSGFSATTRAMNRIWNADQDRPFLKQKLIELFMILVVGDLLLLSTAAGVSLQFLDRFVEAAWGAPAQGAVAVPRNLALTAGAVLANFCAVACIYRYLPNTRVRWAEVWLPAAVVAALFEVGKQAFLWYMQAFGLGSYSLTYGPLATVMIVLLWTYLTTALLLAGAEVAAAFSPQTHPDASKYVTQVRGEEDG